MHLRETISKRYVKMIHRPVMQQRVEVETEGNSCSDVNQNEKKLVIWSSRKDINHNLLNMSILISDQNSLADYGGLDSMLNVFKKRNKEYN